MAKIEEERRMFELYGPTVAGIENAMNETGMTRQEALDAARRTGEIDPEVLKAAGEKLLEIEITKINGK